MPPKPRPTRKLSPEEEIKAAGASSYSDFAKVWLGKDLYPKQKEILDALMLNGSYVSARMCNGAGKTNEIITSAILGHLTLFGGKVISTSGAFRQIKDQLNPALHAYEHLFPGMRFLDCRIETNSANSFWSGFSTNDAGKFEGEHGSEACPLLIIVDEAKTVKDMIFQAIERCRPPRKWCRVLVLSSPGYAQGEFYRLHTDRQSSLTHPPIKMTAEECPHISPQEVLELRAKWGNEHPLVKSMIDAEFMPFVAGAIIPLDALDELLANPPPHRPGERKAFCDFAWSETGSGDENVLALRDGNRVTLEACFREKGLHAVCGRFAREFVRLGLKPHEIEGDGDGHGATIIKQLRNMGWPIGAAHNGDAPRYSDHYANLASEVWVEGARAIINREIILPNDSELYGQLLNRRIVPGNKGKLCIESKQAMKDPNREGGSVSCSPDRADATLGCMTPLRSMRGHLVMGSKQTEQPAPSKNDFDSWTQQMPEEQQFIPGAYC